MKIFNTQPRSAMAVKLVGLLILLISLFVPEASATTEWWGDLRAQFNPPKFPPFYDVTYDDSGIDKLSHHEAPISVHLAIPISRGLPTWSAIYGHPGVRLLRWDACHETSGEAY